jgi:hypothetical protein
MLLRLYNDDSPLIGLPNDKTEQETKGSAPSMKDGCSDKAEDDQTRNDTEVDRDRRRDNTSSERVDN